MVLSSAILSHYTQRGKEKKGHQWIFNYSSFSIVPRVNGSCLLTNAAAASGRGGEKSEKPRGVKLARSRNQSASLTKRETKGITITRKRKGLNRKSERQREKEVARCSLNFSPTSMNIWLTGAYVMCAPRHKTHSSRSAGTNWKITDKPNRGILTLELSKVKNGRFTTSQIF